MKKIAALVLLLALTSLTWGASNDAVTLPFTANKRNLMVVEITLNGKAHKLVFDTGCERTMINDPANVEREADVAFADAKLGAMPLAYVQMQGHALDVIKEVGAEGLLGEDIMRRFKSVTVDYKTHTITLTK